MRIGRERQGRRKCRLEPAWASEMDGDGSQQDRRAPLGLPAQHGLQAGKSQERESLIVENRRLVQDPPVPRDEGSDQSVGSDIAGRERLETPTQHRLVDVRAKAARGLQRIELTWLDPGATRPVDSDSARIEGLVEGPRNVDPRSAP